MVPELRITAWAASSEPTRCFAEAISWHDSFRVEENLGCVEVGSSDSSSKSTESPLNRYAPTDMRHHSAE